MSLENSEVNIVQTITETINNLFSNLFSSIDNSLYSILDDLLFINSDILENKYMDKIFGSSTSGLLLICNSLLLGFCIYYGIKLLLSYITFSEIQRPNQFIKYSGSRSKRLDYLLVVLVPGAQLASHELLVAALLLKFYDWFNQQLQKD